MEILVNSSGKVFYKHKHPVRKKSLICSKVQAIWASLVMQRLKRLPAMWETWVRSLGGEDPIEKEMASHSSILAWRIPWPEEPGELQSMVSQESDMTE